MPISYPFFDAVILEADCTVYDGKPCVEALVRIGIVKQPYTLVLSLAQVRDTDIVEVVK